ncbi:DNA binding domain, excisionase family [Arcticibacter svalbardensis MN12-7]|uniref:DNA binding domain, excisionase family n=1 Tax=Arcticibacter svalbardensis MN12-7 TaxID=1150600 RepID=R9GRQ3_9SPHI|nr:helix-turn-helix domain-containing protein [Arcticibacter svalbardensis]EOR94205.1 DNA binding domain, excisionase family [Arcticibacter svalbardensis MN12-7]
MNEYEFTNIDTQDSVLHEPLSLEQVPFAIGVLLKKLSVIEKLLLEFQGQHEEPNEMMSISKAAEFLKLSVPTIYSKVSRKQIPVCKQGKRLYFYRSELREWIKSGRLRTTVDIRREAENRLSKYKNRG